MSKKFRCFVIMPYSEDSDQVFSEAIVPALRSLPDYNVIVLRADQIGQKELTLKAHVESSVESADFIIADLTGANPNVMYELGYASAMNKPIIMINGDPLKQVPIAVRPQHVIGYERTKLGPFQGHLSLICLNAIKRIEAKESLASGGVPHEVRLYQSQESSDLSQAFRTANRRINILATNLSSVANTYIDDLKIALNESKDLQVRVLALDPESSLVSYRANQLGLSVYNYRMELRSAIERLLREMNAYGTRFTLRTYDDLPTQTMFLVDDHIYLSSIVPGIRSHLVSMFKVKAKTPGADRSFELPFTITWATSKSEPSWARRE